MSRRSVLSFFLLIPSVAMTLAASSASATPLCYSASTVGNVPGSHTVGPFCVIQYPFGVNCRYEKTGIDPTAGVVVNYCTP